jgi:hypothetical protein
VGTKTGCNGLSKVSTYYDTFYGKYNIKNMNIVNRVSNMDGIDEYILLSKESIDRLVEQSRRLDDKSVKLILEMSKWMYKNNLIENEDE